MAEWLHKLNPTELPFELFSDRNPLMWPVARLAAAVRGQRRICHEDNPLLDWQRILSDSIIAALDGYRELRDHGCEQIFLAIYSSPLLQALAGLKATDAAPRRRPGLDPERIAFIRQRIAELTARLAEGGLREAAIRSLVYIGLAGPGVDERAFNELIRIRAQHPDISLEDFKQVLREQFFALMLDLEGALAAIPKMLPDDADERIAVLNDIRTVASAAEELTGERAQRMAQIERLFGLDSPARF
jgi:hypothetical protein